MDRNTFELYNDGERKLTCTFRNCQRGSQNVVYKIVTDDGMTYIGNAGFEGILGRLRQYPHENSRVWNKITESGHCTVYAICYERDTRMRYILENRHIYNEARRLLAKKGFKGNYTPSQVNVLMPRVADSLINKRLDRCYDLTMEMALGNV